MEKTLDGQNKEYRKKSEDKLQKEKDQIKVKFYFWEWCSSYGWRQMGNMEGYDSLEELKEGCDFYINGSKDKKYSSSDNWKILKATVVESKKIG